MEPSLHMLEYDAILQKLADFTHTRAARERALGLHPLHRVDYIGKLAYAGGLN